MIRAAGLSLLLLTTGAARAQPASRVATDAAFATFLGGCAPNVGDAAATEAFVRARGFVPASFAVTARVAPDGGKRVWLLPERDIGVSVLTEPNGLACRVYLRRGDLIALRIRFISAVEGLAGPSMTVEGLGDVAATPGGRTAVNLTYRVHGEPRLPGRPDRLFSLTTNGAPDAYAAAILTVAEVR